MASFRKVCGLLNHFDSFFSVSLDVLPDVFFRIIVGTIIKPFSSLKTPGIFSEKISKAFLLKTFSASSNVMFVFLSYHIGASLKDAGKKCFGITRIEDIGIVSDILQRLEIETEEANN